MNPISLMIHNAADPYVSRAGSPGTTTAGTTATPKPGTPSEPGDSVQISPEAQRQVLETGRIALNRMAGNITADQASALSGQLASIHKEIAADKANDGGTLSDADAQAINQLQNDLSQQIYGDAHNGAPLPTGGSAPGYAVREAFQGGRIALNEKAGNLTDAEAKPLLSQLSSIHQQIAADKAANGGTLSPGDAQTISQLQDQLSKQIYDAAR